MTVDAHLHVWDPEALRYPWLDEEPALNRPFLPGDVGSDTVREVVFVQAAAHDGLAEARWVQSLDWPQLCGIVAFAPVETRELDVVLAALEQLPAFVGVRRLLQDEDDAFIGSTALRRGLTVLAERGIPFDACIRHPQLPALVDTVRAVPELTVVLDHLGKPPVAAGRRSADGMAWRAALAELAELPNTVVKVSGLASEVDPTRPLRDQIVPFVADALELFGPERIMVGSDFPVSGATAHHLGYDEWFQVAADLLELSPHEHDQVFSLTARRIFQPRAVGVGGPT